MKKLIYQLAPRAKRMPLRGTSLYAQLTVHHLYKPLAKSHPFDFYSINPPSDEIRDLNAFGYLIKGEAGAMGMSFVGARTIFGDHPNQEDAVDFDFIKGQEWDLLGVSGKQDALKKSILALGEELIRTDDEGECLAELSGSTLVVSVADSEGITWASVGDSSILLCVVKPDKKVHLHAVNPLHTVNSAEVLKIKAHHPNILKLMMRDTKPKALARPRICGLEMSRALGDEFVVTEAGIEYTPDLGALFYEGIAGYDPQTDKLYVLNASDGLFHSALLSDTEHQQINLQPLPEWSAPPLWEKSNLDDSQKVFCKHLDSFEFRDQMKQTLFLKIYEQAIENALRNRAESFEEGILHAISGELASRCQNHISNSQDNVSCVIFPAGPMMSSPVIALVADGHTGTETSLYLKENLGKKLESIIKNSAPRMSPCTEGDDISETSSPVSKF